ncbi:putative methyltransferase TRM13, tRNA:m(4)X modification enzyme Trm13 [Helianthus anomalus]
MTTIQWRLKKIRRWCQDIGFRRCFLTVKRKWNWSKPGRFVNLFRRIQTEIRFVGIYDKFMNAFLNAVKRLKFGNGFSEGVPQFDLIVPIALEEGADNSYSRGLSIATCCHHLCQWKHYIRKNVKNICGDSNMSVAERAALGFMCKDINDAGRFMWLREYGLESKLSNMFHLTSLLKTICSSQSVEDLDLEFRIGNIDRKTPCKS